MKTQLIKNIFCGFCIVVILFFSGSAIIEYYNPDRKADNRDYLDFVSEKYKNFGLNYILENKK